MLQDADISSGERLLITGQNTVIYALDITMDAYSIVNMAMDAYIIDPHVPATRGFSATTLGVDKSSPSIHFHPDVDNTEI